MAPPNGRLASKTSKTSKLAITLLIFSITLAFFLALPSFGRSPASSKITPVRRQNESAEPVSALLYDEYSEHNNTLVRRIDPYKCTKDIPCHTKACCGSFGADGVGTCGFGPTFCGSDCASQCDAKPECGQYAVPAGKTCPLNVCCSKFGFCGTTSLFCDTSEGCQSNCGTPAVPPGKSAKPVTHRVIGYYEAWSARRECYPFPPAAIPIEGLTHLNFAFGYIAPSSYEVTPMDGATPASLFTQTADVRSLKSGLSDLKVYISLGGWTFSDNGTDTQPLFSEIASTESNRKKFANNLVDFMKKYGFDGVDIDWEYPGAPDRGGEEHDTSNFVALLKTLKETFDASIHGPYGLTFTIPSSYWYLRWFDVPGMLKYADWTNIMSYDLHGVWDKENPIGSIVQSHTNLTEIKLSMELLWRNNVAPEQVVLGLGFYGRSFQLQDKSCSTPGCEFAGAAEPGSCTKNGGTLAYFEIQDIIKDQNPKVIHDKAAASKYFVYGRDQWVSFDDADTFTQKVDYANSVGLGGLMIWSVDQDDKEFSAMQGLLGMSLQSYSVLLKRAETTDAGKWTSLNGQKCVMSDCGVPAQCPDGYGMAPGGEGFEDDCGSSKFRIICCPLNSMPESCLWRGGEGTSGRPSCHGQCHVGETTLFHSRHATKNCLRPGWQAFCCTAQTWAHQIAACKYSKCRGSCGDTDDTKGMKKVASISDDCIFGYKEICCPPDAAFENCHWVGKGSCDDNECADNDVQLALDPFGDNQNRCGLNRKKVLCCNTPKNLNPFLPVSLDKVFPTMPPETDYPQFDLQALGATNPVTIDLDHNVFGMVIIVGPASTVHTLRRSDGSDAYVLDCPKIKQEGLSRIRLVCEDGGPDSSCNKIHLDGAQGTIIRLPAGCGPGHYAVLHSARDVSQISTLPGNVARSVPANRTIVELEVSHDFSKVKRDAGDIFVRIDYSNSNQYWSKIVQGDPIKHKRGMAPDLHKRFYSSASSDWKDKFDSLRNLQQPSSLNSNGQLSKDNIKVTLSGEQKEKCTAKGDDGFLNMDIAGKMYEDLEFGFTFVGTIAPTFHIEEANGYYDTSISFNAQLTFDGKGSLDIPAGLESQKLFHSPVSAWGFSHPGICDFGPTVNVEVAMTGKGNIDAKFTAAFSIANSNAVTDSLPTGTGPHDGGVFNKLVSNAWSGDLSLPTKLQPHSIKKARAASPGTGSTILALRLRTISQMKLDLDFYGQKSVATDTQFNQTIESLFRISRESNGDAIVAFSNDQATVESFTTGDLPWGDDDSQRVVGRGDALVLHSGTSTPPARSAPDVEGYPIFGGHDIMSCSDGTGNGGGGSHLDTCVCWNYLDRYDRSLDLDPDTGAPYENVNLRRRRRMRMNDLLFADPLLALNPDTGKPYDEGLITELLEGRAPIQYGSAENYAVTGPSGRRWNVRMGRYPQGRDGDSLNQLNPQAGRYDAEDCYDCSNIAVTSSSTNPDIRVVTEHINERQTEPRAQEFMMNAQTRRGDGSLERSAYPAIPERFLDDNSHLHEDYSTWDPNGPYGNRGRPIDEITNAYGSDTNPGVLVNTEAVLNGIKARMWVGNQPMSDSLWNENGFNLEDPQRSNAAISYIRATMQVVVYLNDAVVNDNWAHIIQDVVDAYRRYAERVQAVDGVTIHPAEMYQEYVLNVVIHNLEDTDRWMLRRIEQLRSVWRNSNHPEAQGVLDQLQETEDQVEELLIDMSRLPLD